MIFIISGSVGVKRYNSLNISSHNKTFEPVSICFLLQQIVDRIQKMSVLSFSDSTLNFLEFKF